MRTRVLRPTLKTPFHIDFAWWQAHDRDWHLFLYSLLCPEHQRQVDPQTGEQTFDWVDPETAEVHQMDQMQYFLTTHCAKAPDFLSPRLPLVDRIFRLFLANNNTPMTPQEIAEALRVPPMTVLRVLSGPKVYRGLRPVTKSA